MDQYKKMLNLRLFVISYLIVVCGLFLYSFTQVDLSLTLSQWSIWQIFQKFFQHIGYFQRPLSASFYISIIFLLYAFYLLFLFLAHKNKITKKQAWIVIMFTSAILAFSYNAFSYDLFNYIFDAKIVTYYFQNPYIHKALDFSGDPMLSFMHWTHRLYPYGPIWLALTVPMSFIGFNFFLLTFFIFKFFIALSFLGTVFFIGKILNKINSKNEIFGILFFALNPLVLIESLVSAHIDIAMMFFCVSSIYLFINKKYARSFILLVISIGVKFATLFLAPVFIYIFILNKRKDSVNWNVFFYSSMVLMSVSVLAVSIRTTFQPWYLLLIMPFAVFSAKKYFVFIPSVVISFFALLQYIPFLYLGNWDNPVPTILFWVTIGSIAFSAFIVFIWFFKQTIQKR